MNCAAKLAFLKDQLERCEGVMVSSTPGEKEYCDALNCWLRLVGVILDFDGRGVISADAAAESPATTAVSLDSDRPSGTLEPGGNEAVEQETRASEPTPAPTAEPVAEPDLPTKQEVRSRLAALSAKYEKLNVAEIMSEMGFTRLSDIPATRYPELLRRVEESVKELD